MDLIALILVIAFIVFMFGLYADSGKSSPSEPHATKHSIEYYSVPK